MMDVDVAAEAMCGGRCRFWWLLCDLGLVQAVAPMPAVDKIVAGGSDSPGQRLGVRWCRVDMGFKARSP